ncbi:MAG: hypothetical protein FJ207_09040 [Gemmatimonadetes bacterium]|nr:hypothetical protein [Gemmatimonadota bacterium]
MSDRQFDTVLARVCDRLNAHAVDYVLFGARALQLWGSARATHDVDILIPKDLDNARRALAALGELGAGLAREWLAAEIVEKPMTIIGDDPRVDLMTVAWSVHYEEAARDSVPFQLEGVTIPVASLDHLIASKRTGRLQDAADIEVLREIKRLRG